MARILFKFVECNDVVRAIVGSKNKRKAYIADAILVDISEKVLIYCLRMKAGLDNFRLSEI